MTSTDEPRGRTQGPTRRLALVGAIALAACSRGRALTDAEAAARAQSTLAPFKTELARTLAGALARGPDDAIDACATRAPELARAASKDGVRVGRASDRRRNPDNAVPSWASSAVTDLARAPRDGEHRVVALPGGRAGYVETITVKAMCLTCHGEAVAPPIAARIAARYPNDAATGFREGDMRGVFWVELPAGP